MDTKIVKYILQNSVFLYSSYILPNVVSAMCEDVLGK